MTLAVYKVHNIPCKWRIKRWLFSTETRLGKEYQSQAEPEQREAVVSGDALFKEIKAVRLRMLVFRFVLSRVGSGDCPNRRN